MARGGLLGERFAHAQLVAVVEELSLGLPPELGEVGGKWALRPTSS